LRIIKVMYFDEPAPAFQPMAIEIKSLMWLSAGFVLLFAIVAGPLKNVAALAAKSLF
jgi:NADH-quinone oxidoreductase subunit N